MLFSYVQRIKTIGVAATVMLAIPFASAEEPPANKDFGFSFTPDGKTAAFYTYRNNKLPDILLRHQNGAEVNLTNRLDTWDIEPNFSPDGSKIIYSSGVDMASLSLRIMNADGSDDRVFYDSDDNEVAANWSPDGTMVMFSAFNNDERTNKIYLADTHGNNVRVLTENLPGQSSNASWSADSKHILFANRPDEKAPRDIYQMDYDGNNLKRLTHDSMSQSAPIYSPDGHHIIYTGQIDDGYSQIYMMPVGGLKEGQKPLQLTQTSAAYHYFLSLKPDNNHIAFSQGDWEKGFSLVTIPAPH
ncbi:TolB family protein [Kordiimonas aquimaris]|uniref:TolB family protein n=1 Tax=Kordiimonas aquimaris TaxID=707591 RepID=UPI0021D01BF6|nr:hypothetical protein [Kordiimonas aquimaris]